MTDKELREEIRLGQNEYLREWRKKNKDKLKEYHKKYWTKKILAKKEGEKNDKK